ncbi:hypothetical protein K7G98_37390, partial [Saccharothrix sp. MB29]|nr:hypothetical protein [Saccharothrix sp. MB29]
MIAIHDLVDRRGMMTGRAAPTGLSERDQRVRAASPTAMSDRGEDAETPALRLARENRRPELAGRHEAGSYRSRTPGGRRDDVDHGRADYGVTVAVSKKSEGCG